MRTALREKYDPDQPRDEDGKWTSGGGGGGDGAAPPAAAPATPPPQSSPRPTPGKISGKEIKGMPEGATIHSRSLSEAMDRGAFEFTAKPAPTGRFETNDRFDLTIAPKLPSGVESYQVWRDEPERVGYYNPKLADLVTEDFGNGLARTSVKAKADVQTDIQSLDDPDTIYRGISFEEWESIQTTGEIKSRGEYNIGEAQQGLTYYTEQADTAAYYASGFAPWQYKATFEKPAFVVAVKRPHEERVVPGTAEHEVGVARPVRADEIVAAWRGDPYAMRPGWMQLRRSGYEGEDFVEGGGSSPSSSVAWSRVDPPRQRRSAVVRAQRMAVARARAERLLNVGLKFNQPRDGSCEPAARPIFEVRYDPDQPRDEGGKWTSGGGDGGAGEAQPASTGVAAERAGQPSVAFSRRSPTDAERLRGTVAVHQPTAESAQALRDAGITPVTYHEAGAAGAGRFHDAIVSAKTGKYAAAVTAYPTEDYAGMRTFLSEDGKAGFALKGDDIVSAFKHPDSDASGFATTALALATQQGGDRLDAFDTVLPELYSQNGFRAVARIPWNDEYAPEGWSKETFRAFNGGSPDVVFMVHDPAGASSYRAGDGARVADYDAGIAAQRAALTQLRQAIAASWRNSVRKWIAIEIGRTPEQVIRTQRMRVARARAEALLEKFDPNQPRDEDGKWTSGGGDGGGGPLPVAPPSSAGARPKIPTGLGKYEVLTVSVLNNDPNRAGLMMDTEVLKNPPEKDLRRFVDDYDVARVMLADNQFYAWDANVTTHEDMRMRLDLKRIEESDILWFEKGKLVGATGKFTPRGEKEPRIQNRHLTVEAFRAKFDPDQPRDEDGKWTSDGGGGSSDAKPPPDAPAGAKHPGQGYSQGAYEKDGVIHTSNVGDAQRALFENRRVELDQPRTLSTLIAKLGETSQKMIAQGQQAPLFDLCNVSVSGTNLFCADEETEILTSDGWKRYDQIAVADEVLTLNHDTGMSEWQPMLRVNILPAERRSMLSMDGNSHSSLTTLDHRWPVLYLRAACGRTSKAVRRWRTSEQLTTWDALILAAECATLPVKPVLPDALVELAAWAWTEGSIRPNGKNIHIFQSRTANPQYCDLIRRALRDLFGEPVKSLTEAIVRTGRGPRHGLAYSDRPAWAEGSQKAIAIFRLTIAASAIVLAYIDEHKAVTPEFLRLLTPDQLQLFIRRSLQADGWISQNSASVFTQKSERSVAMFQMACAMAGMRTCCGTCGDGYHVTVSQPHSSKTVRPVRRARRTAEFRMEVVEHDGIVWCPTTPNGTWLARRRGTVYFTGNCQESQGIPRIEMPQVAKAQTKEFVEYLKDRGYKVTKEKERASYLKATQNQLDGAKVAGIAKDKLGGDPDAKMKRIVVDRSGYILDGHHHWAAKVGLDAMDNNLTNDSKMRIARVDISITQLLAEADKFTGGAGKKPAGARAFDPDQPRDEEGKWTSGGGGGSSDASVAVGQQPAVGPAPKPTPAAKPTPTRPQPKVRRMSTWVSRNGMDRVESAVAAIPDKHARRLRDVPIKLSEKTTQVLKGEGDTVGLFVSPHPAGRQFKPYIKLGERFPYQYQGRTHMISYHNLEAVTLHEIGHALDYKSGWKYGADINADVVTGIERMTDAEKQNAKRLITKDAQRGAYTEAFAELYSMAYNPLTHAPGVPTVDIRYFGMKRERAEQVFAEALANVRSKQHPAAQRQIEDDSGPVENGWFVTTDGIVYAVINGSAYQMDATGTPLANLPPGDYTEEEAEAALSRLDERPKWLQDMLAKAFDPDQPRDEDGKWTSGGGGGGGDGASSGGKPAPRRSETTILQLLEPSFETGPHPVEVMINPNHRDLISLAKDSPIAGGDDAYDIGGVSGEYFAHAQGALRVVHDTTGNLFAWNAERALHDDVVNEIGNLSGMDDIWEHIDDDGDLWYLVGGRLHSDIGYQNAYARQSDRGEETDTDAAREARMRAARRQVNEWIAQGTAAARTAKKWPKWLRDMLAKAFDPNQPRDEQGRWTDGGGGDGGGAATPASSQRPAGAKHPGAGYSKDSWEDASGVIHTGDVYDAQRALHDGRKVSLDQPRTLSTLLDKLGATAKDMAAKGENAPAVDLCNVTVKGTSLFCADTQGIPRIQMPQLPGDKIDAFADYLKQQGYTSERTTELASYLKATQNQLDGTKVAGMMGAMEKTPDAAWITSPLVVSRDDYIVDGHHRWAAKVGMDARNNNLEQGMRMNVVRVDIGIIDLLQHAHTFTGGKGRVGFGERALQTMRGQKYLQDWWSNLVTKSLDQPKWLRDMLPKAFDPDQPRDETGKWTSGGGDGGGGAAPAATPAAPPAASAAKPQITPLVGVSKDGARRVERALSAIPAAHAEALKDVKIYIQPTSTIIGYDPGGGDVTGKYSPINQTIQVAETVPVKFPKKTVDIPYSNLERVTLHELGHAFDDRYVSTKSAEIAGDVSTGIGRMTRQEKADGAYFILGDRGGINAGESFAELYSLAYNPVQSGERAGPLQVYFGGLSRRRAETVFKEALAKVRAM